MFKSLFSKDEFEAKFEKLVESWTETQSASDSETEEEDAPMPKKGRLIDL